MPKKQDEGSIYKLEIKALKEKGPERLYFIYGPEDYLSSAFLGELRNLCLPEGDDGFSLKCFEGPSLDLSSLREAVNAMPFLSDRTFVELHNIDTNKLSDPDGFVKVLSDIPDYCTVVFSQDFTFEPDGRLKITKFLKTQGHTLFFKTQEDGVLVPWIRKRFSSFGKKIDGDACDRLMFISGTLMNRLIPEIAKIAGAVSGDTVTAEDINLLANRIPEADVFEMVDAISDKNIDLAATLLGELLFDKKTEPIMVLGLIGLNMRRLYGVKLVMKAGLGAKGVSELMKTNWTSLINKTMASAKRFSENFLMDSVRLCAETDYLMKSGTEDDAELLKELVFRLCA